jgi:hypothetical protein
MSLISLLPAHILTIAKLIKTYVHILTKLFIPVGVITAIIDHTAPKVAETRTLKIVAANLQILLTIKSRMKSITRLIPNSTSK